MARVQPSHRVHAHLVGRLLEPDGVAARLVHLFAGLVTHKCVAEDGSCRFLILQGDAHCDQ